jgi:hypothetical protein
MVIFDYNGNGQRLWVGTNGWTVLPGEDLLRFIQFDAAPTPGSSFTVTNISFNYGDFQTSTNFNILNSNVYYSTNNWSTRTPLASGLAYLNTAMTSFAQVVSIPVASGSTFSLRIYPFAVQNGIGGTPTFAIHNTVVINGTTASAFGTICGVKFNDLNGNGVKDPGEPGLPNWQINTNITAIPPIMTDSLGRYCFSNVPAGTIIISEVNQTGWQQTAPSSPGTFTVTLAAGQTINNLNFGNLLTPAFGTICGVKFNDLNGNGVKDPGEPGLPNWQINTNIAPIPPVLTDSLGRYCFINVPAGTIIITEVNQTGWQQTAPPYPGSYTVTLAAGQTISNLNFGNNLVAKFGSICGVKFNDLNGNGVKDPGEPGLPNWQINTNITAIPPVLTDSLGRYCFTNVPAGTIIISEVNQTGWQQTAPPSPGTYTVTLAAGQTINNLNFGNMLVPVVGCVTPPSGMVAWWPLDETTGSTATDLAGFNNSGTHINGPVPVPAKVLGGLQFDGINDYVTVPDHPELNFGTGDFSIDAWIRTSDNAGIKIIVDKQTLNGFNYQGYSFYLTVGYLSLQLADAVPPNYFTNYGSLVAVADGNWHHIAVTVARSLHNGILFYRDGVGSPVGDPTVRPGSLTTTSPLTIGRQSFADQNEFKGILDEVELFNRVLTPSEIVAIVSAGSSGKCKTGKPTGVEKTEEVPQQSELMQSYPNPFNPTTQIEYRLSSDEFVSLRVYNSLGQQVAVLVNEQRPAGVHTVTFHATDLPSGMYFYRMMAGAFQQTRKLLLLK